jgi:hypothetical protein
MVSHRAFFFCFLRLAGWSFPSLAADCKQERSVNGCYSVQHVFILILHKQIIFYSFIFLLGLLTISRFGSRLSSTRALPQGNDAPEYGIRTTA